MMLRSAGFRGQLKLDDFLDPFNLFVLPRFEGRAIYERLRILALKIAYDNGAVTSDDLRPYCPPGTNRKILGAVLGSLKRAGMIKAVGTTRTGVPSSHGRVIWVYRLTEEGKKFLESLQEVE